MSMEQNKTQESTLAYNRDYMIERDYLPDHLLNTLEHFFHENGVKKILEVGVGSGKLMKALRRMGYEVDGIDISPASAELADAQVASATNIPFVDDSFDCVLGISIIEHLTREAGICFINEAKRVLKQDGVIFLVTPNFSSPLRYLQRENWFAYSDKTHIFFYSPKTLKKLLHNREFYELKCTFKTTTASLEWPLPSFFQRLPVFFKRLVNHIFISSPLAFYRDSFWISGKKRKVKIGVLIDRFNVGGVEKIAIEEVHAFRDMGINAVLVVLSKKAIVEGAFKDLLTGIPIEYLEDRLPYFLKFSFKIPFFSFFSFFHISYPFFLPWVIKKKEYDILLSHNTYTSFTALTISKWKAIPYAIFVYDPIGYIIKKAYPHGPIKWVREFLLFIANALDKLIVNRAKVVFVNGDLHYSYLKKIMYDNSKLVILPLGHDFSRKTPDFRGDYILTVTAWKYGKGLEMLLDVLKEINNAHLVVAGKWLHNQYRKKIDRMITELKLLDRVKIIGGVDEKYLNQLYNKARVTVIVNNERGFGMSALEAAANGCTFVIPNECGVARYFENEKDGFYFRYGDRTLLKNYIIQLLNNERLAYNMGQHAWQVVKANYSWNKHAEVILFRLKKTGIL